MMQTQHYATAQFISGNDGDDDTDDEMSLYSEEEVDLAN
jgi:hypothetical protein